MSKQNSRQHKPAVNEKRDPIAEYLAALEEFYPAAIGAAEVIKRKDNRVIVSIPFPSRVSDRMRLFDHMAEVGTKLLVETNEYIILSWQ
jgi:hypothetical protein